jgi:selenide, water dikinase
MKRLVLVGAGHAHVEVIRRLGIQKPAGVEIAVISESAQAGYSGMMPGVIAGHYAREAAEVNVSALCTRAGIPFHLASLQALDPQAQTIMTDSGIFNYDVASLNLGSQPAMPQAIDGGQHLPVKPFAAFLDQLNALESATRVAVIGGGAAAVEIVLALHYRLTVTNRVRPEMTLICAGPRILAGYPEQIIWRAEQALKSCNVKLILNTKAVAAATHGVQLAPGGAWFICDASVWATGPRPVDALAMGALTRTDDGFIAVDACQRSISNPAVFAVGDCASMVTGALPKSGVVPVRQGPWLADQLLRALHGEPVMPFVNQPTALALLSLGSKRAVGAKGEMVFSGPWVWYWKDWIDRRFMAKFN